MTVLRDGDDRHDLLDSLDYPKGKLAKLNIQLQEVELLFRDLKTTLSMDVLRRLLNFAHCIFLNTRYNQPGKSV